MGEQGQRLMRYLFSDFKTPHSRRWSKWSWFLDFTVAVDCDLLWKAVYCTELQSNSLAWETLAYLSEEACMFEDVRKLYCEAQYKIRMLGITWTASSGRTTTIQIWDQIRQKWSEVTTGEGCDVEYLEPPIKAAHRYIMCFRPRRIFEYLARVTFLPPQLSEGIPHDANEILVKGLGNVQLSIRHFYLLNIWMHASL